MLDGMGDNDAEEVGGGGNDDAAGAHHNPEGKTKRDNIPVHLAWTSLTVLLTMLILGRVNSHYSPSFVSPLVYLSHHITKPTILFPLYLH